MNFLSKLITVIRITYGVVAKFEVPRLECDIGLIERQKTFFQFGVREIDFCFEQPMDKCYFRPANESNK
jgi:hypothetical protein